MQKTAYIRDISKQTITIENKTYYPDEFGNIPDSPEMNDLKEFLKEWFDPQNYITVQTSGSTGTPKQIRAGKEQMMNSAVCTCSFLGLEKGDKALLCMSLKYIGAKMMVVRALVAGLNLTVREASGHPLDKIFSPVDFAAMVPLQVYNSLQVPEEKEKLKQIKNLIIGGSLIDNTLEKELQNFSNAVYSTYGMTETLSHIALRKLNGADASLFYTPFPSVKTTVTSEGTLSIDAPLLSNQPIQTNDLAEINQKGQFRITGRKDNIINTGGIKISIEKLEELFSPFISFPFIITSIPDEKFGEIITMLIVADTVPSFSFPEEIPTTYIPKQYYPVKEIPLTENGKINRAACKQLAETYAKK